MTPRLACATGIAGLAILAAGCDSDDSLDLRPYTIDTRRDGQPTGALVAHESPDGWALAAEASPGVFTFTPTGEDVVYALICPPSPNNDYVTVELGYETLGGPDDPRVYQQFCYRYSPPADRQLIAFTVVPEEVSLGVGGAGSFGNLGNFTMRVPPGPVDLVAMSADRVLIERGVTFDPATPVLVDLTTEGVDRVPFNLALPAGAAGETVGASYWFRTAGGATSIDFTPRPDVRVVPATLVQSGDMHRVEATAERDGSRRWVMTSGADPSQLDLSAGFVPTFATVDASWDEQFVLRWTGRPAEATWTNATISHGGDRTVSWSADFHESWLARHEQDSNGTWTPPDLSAVAGWSPTWSLDRAQRSSAFWALGYVDGVEVDGDIAAGRGSDWFGDFFEDPSLRAPAPVRRTVTR